jgi:hypothetical protein
VYNGPFQARVVDHTALCDTQATETNRTVLSLPETSPYHAPIVSQMHTSILHRSFMDLASIGILVAEWKHVLTQQPETLSGHISSK